jgi:hypothetical protein
MVNADPPMSSVTAVSAAANRNPAPTRLPDTMWRSYRCRKTHWKQSQNWKGLPRGIGSTPSAPGPTGCGKRDYGPPKVSSGKRPKSARYFLRPAALRSRSPLCRRAGEKHLVTSETLIAAPDEEWHRPLRFRRGGSGSSPPTRKSRDGAATQKQSSVRQEGRNGDYRDVAGTDRDHGSRNANRRRQPARRHS